MCKIYKHFLTKHLYDGYLIISDIKTVTLFNQWHLQEVTSGSIEEGTFTETDCGLRFDSAIWRSTLSQCTL